MSADRVRFLVLALAGLLVLALIGTLTRTDPDVRNVRLFPEMFHGPAYASFSPNPNYPDGRTEQPLVSGVIVRGQLPFRYGTGPEEAARAGRELVSPVDAADPHVIERGAELYRINCLPCHDVRGEGRGPVTLRGMLPPPSFHAARALALPDGELFHVLTRGQGNMQSAAFRLAPIERWEVVAHIRRLQQEGP